MPKLALQISEAVLLPLLLCCCHTATPATTAAALAGVTTVVAASTAATAAVTGGGDVTTASVGLTIAAATVAVIRLTGSAGGGGPNAFPRGQMHPCPLQTHRCHMHLCIWSELCSAASALSRCYLPCCLCPPVHAHGFLSHCELSMLSGPRHICDGTWLATKKLFIAIAYALVGLG